MTDRTVTSFTAVLLVAVAAQCITLFVGSERAGRAAAIYYSLVESCKVNQVNPLTYLT